MPASEFKFGDRLIHSARPEWGVGVVTAAQNIVQDGLAGQRLTLRFERAGLKTLSTPLASLRYADEASSPDAGSSEPGASLGPASEGWLSKLEAGDVNEVMGRLPEATRDPFTTLGERLKATLALYRFTDQGGALLDWASIQMGVKDPMHRFNRHELEVYFRRFALERDAHLKKLIVEIKKDPPPDLARIISEAPQLGRDALQRLHRAR